jgi:hypothetical protein
MLTCYQGQNQAYGIFQAYHRENIGNESAILPDHESSRRPVVALGGSLGGIGLCMLLGVLLLPPMCWARTFKWGFLHISSVSIMAALGSTIIFAAYLGAALSNRVRVKHSDWAIRLTRPALATGFHSRYNGGNRWLSALLPNYNNGCRILRRKARNGYWHLEHG